MGAALWHGSRAENIANHGYHYIFPTHGNRQVRYFLITCSYARKSVRSKQNHERLNQRSLQKTTLTIRRTHEEMYSGEITNIS